jgi:hypothetical protein
MERPMRRAFASAAALLLTGSAAAAMEPKAAVQAVDASIARDWPKLDALYKDIHAHPELAFQEVRSAAILAKEMRALGFTVTEGVGKTGVVAILKNGAGPTIMVRTEMDGLPMEEKRACLTPAGCRWRRRAEARASSPKAAGTTITWRGGWGRPRRWWE